MLIRQEVVGKFYSRGSSVGASLVIAQYRCSYRHHIG
jgi:hypothetical protein